MDSRAQIYSITFTCLKSGEGGGICSCLRCCACARFVLLQQKTFWSKSKTQPRTV